MKHTFTNLLTRLCANTPPCFGKRSSQCALRSKSARYLFSLLVILTLGVGTSWGANGDVLFTQNFSGTGSLTYTQNVALTKTSGLIGIVGDAANLFTSVTTSNKNSTGIAINHATGGNSTDATGFFQAYFNNTSGYWSAIRTNDLAGTAPTAIKFSMDFYFGNCGSTSSATLVNIAVGDGFTESLKSSSAENAGLVHSGWGITVESSPKLCAYNTYGTKIYNTALNYSKWYSITWVINNTDETLTYNNPTGTGTTSLANDKYDIWLKEQSQGASSYTKVASAVSATTADKALQELYFGHVAGKKHEFRLDNLVITDLTPAAASCEDAPTVSSITKGATTATTQVMNCAGISSLGSEGCTISSYGFVYGTSANPTISDTKVQVGTTYTTTGTAFATTTLTGLTPSTTYYVRAYATNGAGTAYSGQETFTTPSSAGNVAYVASSADASNDAIKALRDANYVVTVRTKAGSPNYEGVDLVVLDESLSWANSDEGGSVIAADVPILNLKAFFYTLSNRWNWGTPVNPSPKSELATLSTEYSNVSSHPIFDGVTISEGAVDMIGTAKDGNNLQGVTTSTLVSGKEGYTLATSASGTTCIHELTPAQRGVTNSKYLLIALSNNVKDNYSADAKKMIVNAAAYLIDNSEQWAPATSCAAPTAVTIAPTEIAGNYGWRYSIGGTIDLTCSYTGGTGTPSYQWQKYVTSDWEDIDGATSARLQIEDCASTDGGSYRCVVSMGSDCDLASDGYFVRVFTLNGNYNDGAWAENAITWTGASTGTVTLHLNESSKYQFKVTDNDGKWFGYSENNYIIYPVDWNCGTENHNCRLFTGPEGDYVVTINIANAGAATPIVNMQVAYPDVTHPAEGYVYFTKGDYTWTNIAAHWWYWDGEAATNFVAWENNPWMTQTATICGTTYYYMPKLAGYNRVIFHNAEGEGQTADITVDASSSGKYISGNNTEWTAFAKYTISFEGNGKTSGEMSAIANLECGANQTLPANAFEKSGYTFSHWTADVDVTVGESTITAGNTIESGVTLKNINSDITLTAQWDEIPTYTISLDANGGSAASYEGWTKVGDVYSMTVEEGTEVTLPTFTKANRTFKTWRNTVPADVASPITVTADVTLTAVWNATIENIIYSWEGGIPATEVGGTAETYTGNDKDGSNSAVNATSAATSASVTYKTIRLAKAADYSQEHVRISLNQNILEGDKVRMTMFICKSSSASAAPKMDTQAGTSIFAESTDVENIYESGSPVTRVYTVPEGISTNAVKMTRNSGKTGSTVWITKLQIIREVVTEEANIKTVTFRYNDGATANKVVEVVSGSTISAEAAPTYAHHRFNEWQLSGSAYDFSSTVTSNITLDATWTQLYTITYANGGGSGSAPTAVPDKAKDETFTVAENTFTAPDGKEFDKWNDGSADYNPGDTYTVGTANVTLTAVWKDPVVKYAITKGTHTNGDFTISVAEQEAGGAVTLTATPDEDYVFSAWAVVKTEDGSATGITVSNNTFTMPAYGVTVNATFAADPRQKVLYVTATAEETVKANDKLYAALKDTYNVKIVGPDSDADQSDYALVVLHESLNGGNDYNNTAVAAAKIGNVPVLNTKAYFYNSGRFGWGTPNAGQSVKGATLNSAYCNIADHPLFNDVTVSEGFFEITDDAAAKCMQPVGSFTSGKEGYILATTPNAESGNGCAIHELTPTQRGASAGKYLMISVSSAKLDALNANGQKLFQNAAAYLIGSSAWEPIVVPTAAAITADPNAAYFVGDNIALTASATGTSAATTYTWYKGDNLAAAKEAGAIQVAKTAAEDGNVYGVTDCALGNAGTYWCVISNGTDCEAAASLAITVSDIAYNISFSSAHGTAPTATTGVSYTLPELTASGWEHQGWTANINVEVDAETVTAGTTIANGKIATFAADVTFTAVWVQVFDVTFNMQSHGASIAAQHIVDGGKATEPNDPSAIGWDFGGWFTDAECTEGNEFDFNTAISDDTELFAKWTAFTGCTELWPATSGDAPAAVGDAIVMQTGSNGASMTALAKPDKLSYTGSGLQFSSESGVKVKVVLNNDMTVGTKISLTLVANGGKTRGLNLYTKDADKINDFTCWVDGTNPASDGAEETFTYTVVADDGLDGTNEFQLWRNNTVCLKSLKVESCGAAVIYHDLTSAVDPTDKGTVTLGASSVREGLTTTATYSAIDEAYEFDEWQISGTGATLSSTTANPVIITMGTADAVVTLKLKAATPKHTVTFNKMGKGDDIASQQVKEGAKVTEPTVTEPEGWILEGWYTENTFETKWDFANDVMSTSDIELFANWVADTSIKLINKSTGAINTTNFATAVAATADVDGEKGATYTSARTAVTSVSALGEMVQYNATTNQTKIQLSMYNTSSNQKTIYLFKVAEGDAEADVTEINIDANSRLTTEYYSFNSDKNRSFYVTVSDTKVKILQVKVVDDGATPMKQFGQAGYSLNFNKGRMFAKNDDSAYPFEGGAIKVSSDYKVLNNSNLATKSYIQFTTTVNGMILRVTRAGGNYYVSQDPSEMGTTYSKNEDITLATAGTWYIGSTSSGSSASFTKFEFIAPKCEAPAFNALTNSDICSGDPYVALDGTGTVSDGGSITYKWYAQGDAETVLATTATYMPEDDGSYYVVALHHVDGYTDNEATSDVVTVTTHEGTAITEGLVNLRGAIDDVVTLSVTATGKNLQYTWKECATIDGTYTAVDGATSAASLDVTITEGLNKYFKVIVHSDCGEDQESIAKVEQFIPVAQANVTTSIIWDWKKAASVDKIQLTASTTPKKNDGFVMANGAATIYNNANFESDKLYLEGEFIIREGDKANPYFQGQLVGFRFAAATEGVVRITYSHTTGTMTEEKPAREIYINDVATGEIADNATFKASALIPVNASEVTITARNINGTAADAKQYLRIAKIEFYALDMVRNDSWIAPGELGTVCYPNGHIVVGADMYQMAGVNENYKFAFDQVEVTEPGVPYLFEATGYDPIRFYKTTAATAAEAGTSNGMVGTFVEKTLSHTTDVNTYYFQGTHFYAVTDRTKDLTVPAYRCYVDLNESHPAAAPKAGVRRITFGVNGTNVVTDIENVQGDDVQCTKVLIDGKIYILRGEKMYDVTGKLVK